MHTERNETPNNKKKIFRNTGNRVLKKSKGKWIIASILTGFFVATGASTVEPVRVMGNTVVEQVMSRFDGSTFDEKAEYLELDVIVQEIQKALDNVTAEWTANTVDDTRTEIERQKELGLDAYVIQWGDTLSVLAEATNQSEDDLARINNIVDKDRIYTGDILVGILEAYEPGTTDESSTTQPTNPTNPQQPDFPEEPSYPEIPIESEDSSESETPSESEGSDETGESDETEESDETDKSEESNESDETDESEESDETDESEESDETDESETPDESENPEESDETDESENPDESEEPGEPENPEDPGSPGEPQEPIEQPDSENLEDWTLIDSADDGIVETIEIPISDEDLIFLEPTPQNYDVEANPIPEDWTEEPNEENSETVVSHTYTTEIIEDSDFETNYIYDPNLTPEESYIAEEGVVGKTQIIYETVTVNGEVLSYTEIERVVLVEKVMPQVVVGTKSNTFETTRQVTERYESKQPIQVIYREVDTLPEGSQEVVQEGSSALMERILLIKELNDEIISQLESSRTVVREATPTIINVGTKPKDVVTTDYVVETIVSSDPIEVQYIDDENLALGEEIIDKEGQVEVVELTYELTLVNGIETDRVEVSREVVQVAKPTIIRRGVKVEDEITVDELVETVTSTEPVEVERIAVDTLAVGEEETIQVGTPAVYDVRYEVTYTNGVETNRVEISRELVQEATPTIVHYGVEAEDEITTETIVVEETSDAEIAIEYIDDDTLVLGQEVVESEGQREVVAITYEVTKVNGVETSRVEQSREVVQESTPTVIRRGTKVEEEDEITTETIVVEETSDVEIAIEYIDDDTLALGQEVVESEGQREVVAITYEVTKVNGVETNRVEQSREVVQEATPTVIRRGTMVEEEDEITTETIVVEETSDAEIEVEYIDDDTLLVGEEEVLIEGVQEVVAITYEVTFVNGVETERIEISREVIQAAEAMVIRRGTKVVDPNDIDGDGIPNEYDPEPEVDNSDTVTVIQDHRLAEGEYHWNGSAQFHAGTGLWNVVYQPKVNDVHEVIVNDVIMPIDLLNGFSNIYFTDGSFDKTVAQMIALNARVIETAAFDTSEKGQNQVKVTVEYADGTQDQVSITLIVSDDQAYDPSDLYGDYDGDGIPNFADPEPTVHNPNARVYNDSRIAKGQYNSNGNYYYIGTGTYTNTYTPIASEALEVNIGGELDRTIESTLVGIKQNVGITHLDMTRQQMIDNGIVIETTSNIDYQVEGTYSIKHTINFIDGTQRVVNVDVRVVNPNAAESVLKGKKWTLLGDSITDADYQGSLNKYDELIRDRTDVLINNQGQSGANVTAHNGNQPVYNIDNSLVNVVKRLNPGEADIITIYAGINDFIHETPIGTSVSMSESDFHGALDSTFRRLKFDNPDAYILYIMPTGVFNNNYGNMVEDNAAYEQYMTAIRQTSSVHGIELFESSVTMKYNPASGRIDNFAEVTGYYSDNLHLNNSGHEVLANEIQNHLELHFTQA